MYIKTFIDKSVSYDNYFFNRVKIKLSIVASRIKYVQNAQSTEREYVRGATV